MNTRCKFRCESVTRLVGTEEVALMAVSGKENEAWSKYTPAGTLRVAITNEVLHGAFEPGKEYFVDVSPVVEG